MNITKTEFKTAMRNRRIERKVACAESREAFYAVLDNANRVFDKFLRPRDVTPVSISVYLYLSK